MAQELGLASWNINKIWFKYRVSICWSWVSPMCTSPECSISGSIYVELLSVTTSWAGLKSDAFGAILRAWAGPLRCIPRLCPQPQDTEVFAELLIPLPCPLDALPSDWKHLQPCLTRTDVFIRSACSYVLFCFAVCSIPWGLSQQQSMHLQIDYIMWGAGLP